MITQITSNFSIFIIKLSVDVIFTRAAMWHREHMKMSENIGSLDLVNNQKLSKVNF